MSAKCHIANVAPTLVSRPVNCGQMAGRVDIPLGLGQSQIVLDKIGIL